MTLVVFNHLCLCLSYVCFALKTNSNSLWLSYVLTNGKAVKVSATIVYSQVASFLCGHAAILSPECSVYEKILNVLLEINGQLRHNVKTSRRRY